MKHAASTLLALAAASFPCAGAAPGIPAEPPWRIVILHGTDGQLPASVQADTAFREVMAASGGTPVEIFQEELDTIRFPAARLDAELVALLKKKHSARPPHVVVAFSNNALEFAERHHKQLWPSASLIFMGIEERALPAARGSHAATGVLTRRHTAATVELGLRLMPRTRRLVLIGGASDWDRDTMAMAKADVARFAGQLELEFLEKLPFAAILTRVRELPDNSLVLPISFFRDSLGQAFFPSTAIATIAEAARVPTLALIDTRIGQKLVGGHVIRYADQGQEAARLALAILGGRDARSLPLRIPESSCVVDWRQLRRWEIPMTRVPQDCEVAFREYTFWEQHWPKILAASAVILVQAFLITILVVQHRRRRLAEQESQRQHTHLAHAARLATVGELTASIAHEINQPLGAILSNADAAEILLESPNPDLAEVRQILADIRRDDERASAVIQRLRTLLARHEIDRQRLDPNTIVREAVTLISPEAERRGMRVVESLGPSVPQIYGDRVHLVQVMIVLLVNALDAMEFTPTARRQVVVTTSGSDGMVEMAVKDAGTGIPAEDFSRLFDSFFTTKDTGMGLGLSIARSIVEAHGGRIWAENPLGGGALFRFRLAVAA